MNNYELIMQHMTIERMAELNVKLTILDNRRILYLTSSGQLFTLDQYANAVNHEYNWLKAQVVANEETESSTDEGEPDACESCCACNCDRDAKVSSDTDEVAG